MSTKSAILVGVGGQGAILTAKVLVNGLMRAGYDVKMSEVHGMSQRGGSVSTQVHWGGKVYSPVIENGEVTVNGEVETRRGKKIVIGDKVAFDGEEISVEA